jgi:quinoprotein glucose dehydrogenase
LTVANAGQLQEAWRYTVDDGDAALEATPIAVGDTVYLCSGTNDVIALSAPTGRDCGAIAVRWTLHMPS